MVLGPRARNCQIRGRTWCALALGAAVFGASTAGLAQSAEGPSGAGGNGDPGSSAGPGAPALSANPGAPALGSEVAPPRTRPDPASAPLVACSFEEPVCVHAAAAAAARPWAVQATLRDAEHVLRAHRALGLPRPLPDGLLGGSPAFDLYLVPGAEPPATAIDLEMRVGSFDRASAFSVLPPPSPRAGCEHRFKVAHALAHAVVARLDAGAEPGAIAMTASYLASLVAPCSVVEIAAVDAIQREPERGIMGAQVGEPSGALLVPWYLDDAYGTGRPASVILGLLAVATQRTPPAAMMWQNEPDIFDALRVSLRVRDQILDDLLLDFAVARAFLGSRSDEAHMTDVARFGDMGRVRFEWSVPFDSLPRRLAPLRPLEPTGATYLWLDLEGAPKGAELTFVADWELPSVFRWALVKVDRTGGEAGRVGVAGVFGSSHAERTVVGLDDLAGILIVGVNAGSMDRSRPFDPDDAPFMPHAYTVTLAK